MIERIEALATIERRAWRALEKAHAELAAVPLDRPLHLTYHRGSVRGATQRWQRAITDLDRALSRPVAEAA